VDALGFSHVDLSDEQIREINATVGAMVRETIDGLMQVLRSRTSIKNEFRINITTIQPVENNPIKFSAGVDEVLELMFLRRSRAYKGPLEAIEESFHSIADHQLAVIAGIRSAFRSVLGKFDPERLEEEFKQTGKGGLLPGVIKGRFWGAYQEHYAKVINDMERSFQELFGDEFVQAYEDQMRKLSQARKRD
jgi:type VI secretion system FHA domain protein